MSKNRALGIWDVYWRNQGYPFPADEIANAIPGQFETPEGVINYLRDGYKILMRRTIISCFLTEELIGSPQIMCDDRFVWSSEYIFYLEKGKLPIDEALLTHIQKNNFSIPVFTEADIPFIDEVLKEINFSPLPGVLFKIIDKE